MWFLLIWYGCGLLGAPFSYAICFYYWQKRYPLLAEKGYHQDRKGSGYWGFLSFLMGPVGLLFSLLIYRHHLGLKWR